MRLLFSEVDILICFKDNRQQTTDNGRQATDNGKATPVYSQQTTDNGRPSGVMGKGKVERGELREERVVSNALRGTN